MILIYEINVVKNLSLALLIINPYHIMLNIFINPCQRGVGGGGGGNKCLALSVGLSIRLPVHPWP